MSKDKISYEINKSIKLNNTCILILGMHRSGTSMLTGILNKLNINVGNDVLQPANDNLKGFFENKKIVEINDQILEYFGYTWDNVDKFPNNWINKLGIKFFYRKLALAIINDFKNNEFFLLKDPRICLLLPLYIKLFNEIGVNLKIIYILRHPSEVAQSLEKRNNMPFEKAINLWINYNNQADINSRDLERYILFYDNLLTNYETELHSIKEYLNLSLQINKENLINISEFISKDLKHNFKKNLNLNSNFRIAEQIFNLLNNNIAYDEIDKLYLEWNQNHKKTDYIDIILLKLKYRLRILKILWLIKKIYRKK